MPSPLKPPYASYVIATPARGQGGKFVALQAVSPPHPAASGPPSPAQSRLGEIATYNARIRRQIRMGEGMCPLRGYAPYSRGPGGKPPGLSFLPCPTQTTGSIPLSSKSLNQICNRKSTIVLVNAGRVNGGSSYFLHATFCVIFCDSGRILDSWNPVKYIRNLSVNLTNA